MTDSITKAGVIFLIYLFMVVASYFVLSAPINAIIDALAGANFGSATTEIATVLPIVRTALQIFFALFLALPMTWFIMWIMHREPSYYQRRWP